MQAALRSSPECVSRDGAAGTLSLAAAAAEVELLDRIVRAEEAESAGVVTAEGAAAVMAGGADGASQTAPAVDEELPVDGAAQDPAEESIIGVMKNEGSILACPARSFKERRGVHAKEVDCGFTGYT